MSYFPRGRASEDDGWAPDRLPPRESESERNAVFR